MGSRRAELALAVVTGASLGLITDPKTAANLITLEMVIPKPTVGTIRDLGEMVLARIPRRKRSRGNACDRLASV